MHDQVDSLARTLTVLKDILNTSYQHTVICSGRLSKLCVGTHSMLYVGFWSMLYVNLLSIHTVPFSLSQLCAGLG